MIEIKRDNKVFYTIEDVCEGSKLSYQLMDHHYVILKFTTEEPIYLEVGDSIELPNFGLFELTSAYFPKKNETTGGYDYEVQFDAYYMAWKNKLCKYRPKFGANETSFKLTSTVDVHMGIILDNLKALGFKYNNDDFSVDYTTYNNKAFDVQKRVYIEYGSISILEALNTICSENALNCEWWIDGSIIYLGYCEMAGQVTFEQDLNVQSMAYSESKSSYITRLYAFGSDRNIPKGYFTGSDAESTKDGIATDYLMLPDKEVDSDGFYAENGYIENINVVKNNKQAVEGVVFFDDEYPKVECYISNIKTYDSTVKNDDGTTTTQTFWQVTSNDSFATSFETGWIKSNLTLGIKFTSGALMGMEFDVSYKIIDKVNYFEIVANDTYGRTLPDGVMCPKVGDKFFLYNWDSTKITDTDLIPTAQLSLFDRAKQYYQKSIICNTNFTCVMDGSKFYNNSTYNYHPLGEQVKLINPMFTQVDAEGKHYRNSRIIGMEINLDIPYDSPQYILGEKAATGKLSKLEDKVDSIVVNGISIPGSGSGGRGVYVIGENDSTPATDSNVLSARKTILSFLSKLHDDTAQGVITFLKGLVSEGLAKLNGGAYFGKWGAMIDEAGRAILESLQSIDYDNDAEQGFAFKKEENGKYNGFITNLTIWGKAIFNELEVRKLSYAGGNIYLSGAGSKIVKAVPVTWESESSEWIETSVEMCKGWLCYLLADDGTTATQNLWREGDQVRCKTIGTLATGTMNASNKSYWRTIPTNGVSSVNEKIYDGYGNELYGGQMFSWIVIGKHSLSLDSLTEELAPEETGGIPEAGDTIVLDGHRAVSIGGQWVDDDSRKGVLILESTGENTPRIVGFKGVDIYAHDGKEVFVLSPDGSRFYSNLFEWVSPSGDTMHMVNYRGEWKKGSYSYYDQVNHNNALWTCINENGTSQEPSDASADWQKVLSGEKGDKGDKGEDGTSVTINGQAEGHYANFAALKADVSSLTQQKGTILLDKSSDYSGGFATPSTIDYVKGSDGSVTWSNIKKANIGDCYILSTTKEIYSNSDGTTWKNLGNIQGPKGDKGDKGETGATGAQGNPGADGANGEDGVSILIAQPIVLDTDDDGIVSDTSRVTAEGRVMVMRGGENVTNECSDVKVSYMLNCTAIASKETWYIKVKLNSVNTTTLESGDKVSMSEGYVTVAFSLEGKSYATQVPFSVNVTKYMGSVKATAKQYQSKFEALENDLNGSNPTVLNAYTSTIKQTAKEITLGVTQSQQGRHNLLRDTALTRRGDIYYSVGTFQPTITQGVNGHNAIRFSVTGDGTGQYHGLFWGQMVNGIAVKKNTDYTFSAWIKSDTKDLQVHSEVFKLPALLSDKRGENIRATSGDMSWQTKENEVNQWRQVNYTFNSGDAEFIEVNIFVYNGNSHTDSGNGWICMPMLEEGSEYTGWTPAETDYDYLGGNMLDDTRTLVASGQLSNLHTALDVAQDTYEGAYAVVHGKADSSNNNMCDFLRFNGENGRLLNFELKKNYVFSFLAKGSGTLRAHLFKDSVHVNIYTENSQGSVTENVADGASNFTLTSEWKRYWVHWRIDPYTGDGDTVLPQSVLLRAVDGCEAWVTKPKLEEGALMTEYTEKKTDLIDKATAKAAGLEITADGVELYGDKVKVKNNGKTAAMFTDGKLNADLIDADTINVHHVWAKDGNNQNTLAHFGNYDIDEAKDESNNRYPLWVGSSTASNAPFKVTKDGYMYAEKGSFGVDYDETDDNGETVKRYGKFVIGSYDLHCGTLGKTQYMSLSYNQLTFGSHNPNGNWINIGHNVVPLPLSNSCASLTIHDSAEYCNIAIYVDVKNAPFNYAMIGNGDVVMNGSVFGYQHTRYELNGKILLVNSIKTLTWIVNATKSGSAISLPTLSALKKLLFSGDVPFCVRFTIIADIGSQSFSVYGRNTVKDSTGTQVCNKPEYPLLTNWNGGYWADFDMAEGDSYDFLLTYDPNKSYTLGGFTQPYLARIINRQY